MNQTKMIMAVCDNCNNKRNINVSTVEKVTKFHAVECDDCGRGWEAKEGYFTFE